MESQAASASAAAAASSSSSVGLQQQQEEEDSSSCIVIVGGGIAGLATALGLHRLGIRSLVLESGDTLRTSSGFALGTWTNAWKALDALSVGDSLRSKHIRLTAMETVSVHSGITTTALPFQQIDSKVDHELRSVNRKVLLETLQNELPEHTIRYSSKVVHIQNTKDHHHSHKSIHLDDGTILKAKVLIGCDGVNSVVAKFLGLSNPRFTDRIGVRALVHYKDGHGFEPKMTQFFGNGFRYGVIPSDDHTIYWFFSFTPAAQEKEMVENPIQMKQFILSKLGKVSDEIRAVFENTQLDNMVCAPLRFRVPWELLWRDITKDNVCVAGDALHPMTPDLGQGGCVALEDAVVLARVLGEALKVNEKENEEMRIRKALEKFGKERRWRSFEMVSTAYMVGYMQQNSGLVLNFVRDKMAKVLAGMLFSKARYDCGKLDSS